MLSLNEISGYNKIREFYEENRDRDPTEWLEVKKIFPRLGKQGIVGLIKNGDADMVFKTSQYINYLAQHENAVAKGLNDISDFCPHFCRGIGIVKLMVDPFTPKNKDPFQICSKYPIEKETVLFEHLEGTTRFDNYIRSKKVKEDVLYAIIKQVLLAIEIAQMKKRWTHYDLHSGNIQVQKCDPDLVFLYVIDKDNQYCVPTLGYRPVIIDYGFSYIGDMDNGPLWPSLGHTDIGFISDRFDPIADPKLFLVSVSSEIKEKQNSKKSKKLRKIVREIFSDLKVDWSCGWNKGEKRSAASSVLNMLRDYNTISDLFDDCGHYCIDLVQSLIILPLEDHDYRNIDKSYIAFLEEFVKIEDTIGSQFYCLYILKGIVDAAREVQADYVSDNHREEAVRFFKRAVYERVDSISQYCDLKSLHFEKMLCSLFCLARNIEGILYMHIDDLMRRKNKDYAKMKVKSPQQMFGIIEEEIRSKYVFNPNTKVMVIDCVEEIAYDLELTEEERVELNDTDSISRGPELYKFYKKS